MNIRLEISEINDENKTDKFQKAVKELSTKMLGKPATIEHKEDHKEEFPYKAQEQLYEKYKIRFGLLMDDLYSRICSTLGIRPVSTFRKAIDPKAPRLRPNEILWNPETGQPITQKELDRLLEAIDKYLNRNLQPWQKEFTLSQSSIARIISNLRKNYSMDALRDRDLNSLKIKNKKWDYVTTYGKLKDAFPTTDLDRLKFRERVVGNYITNISEDTRSKIRDVLDNGFLAGKTKSEISQELFDRFGSLNKDWDRIVDTEGVNIFNSQYIEEQKSDLKPGEPLYFIRREFLDDRTCSFCKQATVTPVIAKWSNVPLSNDKIKDPVASIALWSGKSNAGRSRSDWWWPEGPVHPNGRGSWDRFYPDIGDIDLSLNKSIEENI